MLKFWQKKCHFQKIEIHLQVLLLLKSKRYNAFVIFYSLD
jgi:hypothetical protein